MRWRVFVSGNNSDRLNPCNFTAYNREMVEKVQINYMNVHTCLTNTEKYLCKGRWKDTLRVSTWSGLRK